MSLSKPALLKFKFDDVESLLLKPVGYELTEKLTDCHGNAWKLCLKLSNNSNSNVPTPTVGLFLLNEGTRSLSLNYSFILRDALGKVYHERKFKTLQLKTNKGWGKIKFIKKSRVFNEENNILIDGSLLIDVHLQFRPEPNYLHKQPSSLAKKMLEFLEKEEGADVSFKVGGIIILAHKTILRMNASDLFDFGTDNDDGSPIAINDITPKIFRIILRYIYGEEVPDTNTIMTSTIGKDIITAADRFNIVGLKLAVETALVESLEITKEDVADWLVFADSKTCPLLKEQATNFFVSRSEDVLNSESSKCLKESPKLLAELIMEISNSANGDTPFSDGRNDSVNDLRNQLHERGLDVDGSKEMLVARLQTSNKRQRTE